MAQQRGKTTIQECAEELYKSLLHSTYESPPSSLFENELYWKTLEIVYNQNKGRVIRDIQPYIVPSAEILALRGCLEITYLREKIVTQWNSVVSFAGPQPYPYFALELATSTFTESEINKLEGQPLDVPSRFTGNIYFPFLTCEAKCGANGLNESNRQNTRSAATAVNAILQLYRQGEKARQESGTASGIDQLHRDILFFSISHDYTTVKIFGH